MIKRGFKTGKRRADFFRAKGVLLDAENRCEEARECFSVASDLNPGPHWRLLRSTSFGIENRFDEALAEIELAIAEGAEGPLTDFYYGRCLASVGEFSRAIALFSKVKQRWGLFYELAVTMQEAYYDSWKPFRSAYYETRAALFVVRGSPRKAAQHVIMSAVHCFTPIVVRSAQLISRLSKAVPLLKRSRLAKLCELDEPYFSLGNALAKRGRYAAAKKLFTIAAEKAPLARNCLNLCSAAILTGDRELAENTCLRALKIAPNDPLANQYLEYLRNAPLPLNPHKCEVRFSYLPSPQ